MTTNRLLYLNVLHRIVRGTLVALALFPAFSAVLVVSAVRKWEVEYCGLVE